MPVADPLINFRTADELRVDAQAELDAENPILSGWDVYGLDTAYQDRPPVREIVHGVVSEGSLNIVYGAPGSLKSMLLADMCACVAGGTPWLQHLPDQVSAVAPLRVEQGAVLWIDYDNGRRRTHDRMAALGRAYGLPPDAPFHYASMALPWMDAGNRVQLLHLSRLIEKRSIRMLVVDNLGLISGSAEENTADMVDVMGNLRWLADDTGCAVNIIHHQRKDSPGDDGAPKADALRGHSSILGSLDFALHIQRPSKADHVLLTPTKTRDAIVFDQAGALFTYEHQPDTTTLHTARFWGYSVEGKAGRELNEINAYIFDVVGDTPGLNKGDLVEAVRARMTAEKGHAAAVNKVRDAVAALAQTGKIDARIAPKDGKRKNTEYLHFRPQTARNY